MVCSRLSHVYCIISSCFTLVMIQGTLEENVCYPSSHCPSMKTSDNDISRLNLLETALHDVGLSEIWRRRQCQMKHLSGGQRQRVSFARAIYSGAELVSMS